MSRPDISIITPCFGQAHLLTQAVLSVQQQKISTWELLIVDDGSPDDTAAVAKHLQADDSRVKLIRKPNGGLSSARNAGLTHAQGRYIQFLDADDVLLPDKFSTNLAALQRLPQPALVVDDFATLHSDGQIKTNERSKPRIYSTDAEVELALRWENDLVIPIHSPMFTADLFSEDKVRFDESLPTHEDYAMWLAVLAQRPRIHFTGRLGALYRANPAGMTRNRQRMYDGFIGAIRDRMNAPDLRPTVREALHAKIAVVRNHYGFGARAWVRKTLQRPTLHGQIPWFIQQALRRWTLADSSLHQAALNRRFGLDKSGDGSTPE